MMPREKALLVILCAGMGLSWIYAWAAFIMPILGLYVFSMADGALILALAAGSTSLHQGRGWPMASVIGLHAAGLSFAVCRMIYIPFEWADPFWSGQWLALFFTREHPFLEWIGFMLALLWAGALWTTGIRIVIKTPGRFTISARFDLGAAAFLALLLTLLIMIGKGVPVIGNATFELAFLAFFMLGLLALSMAGAEDRVEKGYMMAYGGMGTVLSFMVLVFFFGGGLVLLFLPSLMTAAEVAHDTLTAMARPLVPVLITVLRVVFLKGCRTMQEEGRPSGQEDPGAGLPPLAGSEPGLFQTILMWGLMGLAGVIGMALLVFGAYHLIRWLASRAPTDENKESLWAVLLRLAGHLKGILLSLSASMVRKRSPRRGGMYFYALLQRWGAHSGLPRVPNETPMEYGFRLAGLFPSLGSEIASVVTLYNESVYALSQPDQKEIHSARLCWHRIRSPFNWPARFRAWFLSPRR